MTEKEYLVDEHQLVYYQYSINPTTGKFNKPQRRYFNAKHVLCSKPISLILNLNKLSHNPYDEQALFNELITYWDMDTDEGATETPLITFCKSHPVLKEHWQLIGTSKQFHNKDQNRYTFDKVEVQQNTTKEFNYYEQYWKPKGLIQPPKLDYCLCGFGLDNNTLKLEHNFYLFNPHNYRLVVIGSECQKKFNKKPLCIVCNSNIKFNEALIYDHRCKRCFYKECCVCKGDVEEMNTNRVCYDCKTLGAKRFKSGKNEGKSYLTLFKEIGDKMTQWNSINPSTHLGKFIGRINTSAKKIEML